jgi:hypothetical protein
VCVLRICYVWPVAWSIFREEAQVIAECWCVKHTVWAGTTRRPPGSTPPARQRTAARRAQRSGSPRSVRTILNKIKRSFLPTHSLSNRTTGHMIGCQDRLGTSIRKLEKQTHALSYFTGGAVDDSAAGPRLRCCGALGVQFRVHAAVLRRPLPVRAEQTLL